MDAKLLCYYMEKYCPACETADDKKGQENRLKPLINKLTSKDGIYKDLPFSLLSIEEQVALLYYILEKAPERQIVSNMGKTDVDRNYYNFVITDEERTNFILGTLGGIKDYEPYDLRGLIEDNRAEIRDFNLSPELVLKDLNDLNEQIIKLFYDEIQLFRMLGIGFENMSYITDYIDYVSIGFLQFLVYRVLAVKGSDAKSILEGLLVEVNKQISLMDNHLDRQREKQKEEGSLTAETLTRYFSFYRTHYSKYYEELGIYHVLKKEIEQFPCMFGVVGDRYKTEKTFVSEEEIESLEDIITEGKGDYNFKDKLKTVREFVDIMRACGGRHCFSNCPQDLKVYYREVFISKQIYKRRQASTIVKDYLKSVKQNGMKPFDKESHYMFVMEKISRGYFREKDMLDIYLWKIDLQQALYGLLLKVYLFYDFWDALEFIYTINYSILRRVREQMGFL